MQWHYLDFYTGTHPITLTLLARKELSTKSAKQWTQNPQKSDWKIYLKRKPSVTSQINRVSAEQVDRALCQWGQWAARPQFWQDLRVAQLLKVYSIGLGGGGDISHRIKLDPQSQAMHRAYHQLQDEKVKVVLYLYYVVGVNFDGLKEREKALLKMGRSSFYRRLNTGSRMLYNRGMSILSSNKKTLDKNSVI